MRTIIRDNYNPQTGDYYDKIVRDTANNKIYFFDCDGVWLNVSRTWLRVRDELGDSDTDAISQRVVTEHLKSIEEELSKIEGGEVSEEELEEVRTELESAIDAEAKTRQLADGNLEMQLSKEISDRETAIAKVSAQVDNETDARTSADNNLQSQIDAIVNSSDVKDVVGTKAELNSYPTSTLGKNDIIKVLSDETADGATTYYRWDGTKFDPIGSVGPYYTKAETDAKLTPISSQVETNTANIATKLGIDDLLEGAGVTLDKEDGKVTINAAGGGIKTLTEADFNWNSSTASATEPYDSVALWLLEPGVYRTGNLSKNQFYYFRGTTNDEPLNKAMYGYIMVDKDSLSVSYMIFSGSYAINEPIMWAQGQLNGGTTSSSKWNYVLSSKDTVDNLDSTSTKYPLSANQGRVLKEMIENLPSGGGGDIKHLSAADYDYPTNSPNAIALWQLKPGYYITDEALNFQLSMSNMSSLNAGQFLITMKEGGTVYAMTFDQDGGWNTKFLRSSGTEYWSRKMLTTGDILDSLDSNVRDKALSANQGYLLGKRVEALEKGGGSDVEVVQSTGDSETAVMSQKATTNMVFATNGGIRIRSGSAFSSDSIVVGGSSARENGIAIGMLSQAANGCVAIGVTTKTNDVSSHPDYSSVAVGSYANAEGQCSIALGTAAHATKQGQFDVSTVGNNGYNNSNYRLLTGLYDPQDDHDAATKAYVDAHMGSVEATQAPGGSTTSVMSQDAVTKLIYTNTTNRESVKIGDGANGGVDSNRSVTIGKDAATIGNRGTTIGTGAMVSGDYGIALGAGSTANAKGEFSVGGNGLGTNGYDGTNTRLITNVHDPVNAQDAATKQYVDNLIASLEARIKALEDK